MTDCFAR